jgi:hypothetical protein
VFATGDSHTRHLLEYASLARILKESFVTFNGGTKKDFWQSIPEEVYIAAFMLSVLFSKFLTDSLANS